MSSPAYVPGVSGIEVHDPGFGIEAFLAGAAQTVRLYGRAFAEGRPELVCGVFAPDLAAGVTSSIKTLVARGVRLAPDDGSVEMEPVTVRSDGAGDTITIAVASTWREQSEAGRRYPQRRREKWEFWRAAGATTPPPPEASQPLSLSLCGQCGAPFDDDEGPAPVCRFCHVPAPVPPWLWVVARIEPG